MVQNKKLFNYANTSLREMTAWPQWGTEVFRGLTFYTYQCRWTNSLWSWETQKSNEDLFEIYRFIMFTLTVQQLMSQVLLVQKSVSQSLLYLERTIRKVFKSARSRKSKCKRTGVLLGWCRFFPSFLYFLNYL